MTAPAGYVRSSSTCESSRSLGSPSGRAQGPLAGKAVAITGAGSGIGRAAAAVCRQAGAALVLVDRDETALTKVTDEVSDDGSGDVIAVVADVRDESQVNAMVAAAIERFGRLDGAINNAGIAPIESTLADASLANWQTVLDVNLTGIFLCMKYEISAMLQGGGGAIVNTTSALGLVGAPMNCSYVASKHGVVGLTKAAALEYGASGIRINAIAPGVIDTPMAAAAATGAESEDAISSFQPIGRLGLPHEIAAAALFLLGDDASFVHGAVLSVDGGYVAQ